MSRTQLAPARWQTSERAAAAIIMSRRDAAEISVSISENEMIVRSLRRGPKISALNF